MWRVRFFMSELDAIKICKEPININEVYLFLSDSRFGAMLIFTGVVRDKNNGADVSAVSYEAFEELAIKTLTEIAGEVREKIERDLKVVIIHRVGTLKVGEISTVIGVASCHREASYDASRYIIEELKVRVPIWKEEHYVSGERSWLEGEKLISKDCGCNSSRG